MGNKKLGTVKITTESPLFDMAAKYPPYISFFLLKANVLILCLRPVSVGISILGVFVQKLSYAWLLIWD